MPLEHGFIDIPVKLDSIDFTRLDAQSIVDETVAWMSISYPDLITDFNKSQTAMMLLHAVAKLAEKLSLRTELLVRDNLLSTSRHKPSVRNMMSLVDYELARPIAALGDGQASINEPLAVAVTIPAGTLVSTQGIDGLPLYFEAYGKDGQGGVDWDANMIIAAGQTTTTCALVEGRTFQESFIQNSEDEYPLFQLDEVNILDFPFTVTINGDTWTQVDRLIYQELAGAYYEVRRNSRGEVFIRFGNGIFGARPPSDSEILVTYRSGGGMRGNLTATYLNASATIPVPAIGRSVSVALTNVSVTSGGVDEETIEHARIYGPKSFATMGRECSGEDYTTFANRYSGASGSVLKALAVHRGRASATGTERGDFVIDGTNYVLKIETNGGVLEFGLTHGTRTAQQVADDITAAGLVLGFAGAVFDSDKVVIYTQNDARRDIKLTLHPVSNSAYVLLGLGMGRYAPWQGRHIDVYAFARGPLDDNGLVTPVALSSVMKAELAEYMNNPAIRMLTDEVEVQDAGLLPIYVKADILVNKSFDASKVKAAVDRAVIAYFDPELWEFGQTFSTVELKKAMYNASRGIEDIIVFSPTNSIPSNSYQLITRGPTELAYYYVDHYRQ